MLNRVSLFTSKRDFFIFLGVCFVILFHSLYLEYKKFENFTRFDSFITKATVQKQYTKTKNKKTYQILKLKSSDGFVFYTKAKKSLENVLSKEIEVEIWVKNITFYDYLNSFFGYGKIISINEKESLKSNLNNSLDDAHPNHQMAQLYKALYLAEDVDQNMQNAFSNLGVSHIVAISGFHLGIISAILYFLLSPIYKFAQDRYFPYRNSKTDIFFITFSVLFAYVLFLDSPPSLLRSFGMFIVGFILYDRGVEIFSMQTLLVTLLLLLAFFPRLFFSLGFWLSAGGVFYIFLFLIHYKHLKVLYQFLGISILVYLYMLPSSLYLFGNFSLYHPSSIILSMLFTPFYPLSILLHFFGWGDIFDGFFEWLLMVGENGIKVDVSIYIFLAHILLSLFAIRYRYAMSVLTIFSSSVFVYAIYQVA